MNSIPPQPVPARPATAPGQKPSVVLPVAVVGALVVCAAVAYKIFENSPPPPVVAASETAPPRPNHPVPTVSPRVEIAQAPAAPVDTVAKLPAKAPAAPVAPREPPADPQQLMASLTALDLKGPISAEDAQKWKASLRQLIAQGSSSVAAIRDYLAQNQDVSYAGVQGADQLGFSSLRAGLLDALGEIGGPESTTAMLQILQTSVFPTDVANLATILEQQAPGQYGNEILSAVRAQLTQASQGQLGNANVGPLFQILASAAASGTDVSADLSQYTTKWPYYAAIDLANLPNGAGITALAQMAQESGPGAQTAAAEALAEMASQNPTALSSLLDLAKQGQLSDNVLAQLAPYLAGRENELGASDNPYATGVQTIHLANGNQDFSAYDSLSTMTPDQAAQRISIIDQILQTLPSDDAQAQAALQQQRINLTGRQAK